MSDREKRNEVRNDATPHGEAAAKDEKEVEHAASVQQAPAGVQSIEPENAYLTGASKQLQGELLRQNVGESDKEDQKPQARPHPDTPPGQHATGSHVDGGK